MRERKIADRSASDGKTLPSLALRSAIGISSRLQVPLHELARQPLVMYAADAVARRGVEHHLKILVRLLQRVDELERVLHMHVVILDAVSEQQSAGDILGVLDQRRVL